MIARLQGKVEEKTVHGVVLTVNGVGYEVQLTEGFLAGLKINSTVVLYTYLHLKTDGLELFGFPTAEERSFFKKLLSVSGCGPRLALSLLSFYTPEDLEKAVREGNVEDLARVPGLGKKTAQRLVLELKGKLVLKEEKPLAQEAVLAKEALRNLGYSANEVKGFLEEIVSDSEKSAEEIVKEVLKRLSGAG